MIDLQNNDEGSNDFTDYNSESDDDSDSDHHHHHHQEQKMTIDNAFMLALMGEMPEEIQRPIDAFDAILKQLNRWQPWWMSYGNSSMMNTMSQLNGEEAPSNNCPDLKAVPKFETLTTEQPSHNVKYNIVNVLASYAIILRYYKGKIDPVEYAICLLSICANLDANTNFEHPALAVESVSHKCLQSELLQIDNSNLESMQSDLYLIIRGPSDESNGYYCKAALSHLHHILTTAKSSGNGSEPGCSNTNENADLQMERLPTLVVTKLEECIKKIEYYLSYIESYNMDLE